MEQPDVVSNATEEHCGGEVRSYSWQYVSSARYQWTLSLEPRRRGEGGVDAHLAAQGLELPYTTGTHTYTHSLILTHLLLQLKQQPDHVHQQQLAFSPCGRFIVFCSASERSLAVYDLFQGSEGYTSVYTRQHIIGSVCWSTNSLYVVAACSTTPRCLVWDTATWTLSTWTLPVCVVSSTCRCRHV